ncbi:zinc metalloprotease [Sandarakinorhabdus oryzae]|uniref:hypothetical protein n=1 Tax=Sandarakinorhabdus oryzae TaxID=2675220 RepID=UPI0012E0CF5F|nr:hypothetical protein [Sandarakinorhabdus oryzae]
MPRKTNGNGGHNGGHTPTDLLISEDQHPDFVAGRVDDGSPQAFTPVPDGPIPQPPPLGGPLPFPRPDLPMPGLPRPEPFPFPDRFPPINLCAAVSGRYRLVQPVIGPVLPGPMLPGPIGRPVPVPSIPLNLMRMTVRVDVDRFFPQQRISVELFNLFPRRSSHVIADVTSDQCLGYNNRRVTATISYRDGDAFPGTTLVFEARRTTGLRYGMYRLTVSGGGAVTRSYDLEFESTYFDSVEFEIDRVSNAGTPVTSINTGTHPNRPADLPVETLELTTVYQRAGFAAYYSPGANVIPVSGAAANGTWSDAEMHNAMVTHWSRFANKPQWALWVLFAARHDQGRSLGGVMFDDIGPNHRQGTAIFTDSFIQDAPAGDANAAAWRQRMVFWTAAHEMGHAFNLAHSWQKALGVAGGGPGDPWIPLANEPEARSFMNYPFRVSGGQASFFADFRFRFTDSELRFLRHAPRRFVQMGNANWFVNHNFEAPDALPQSGRWKLAIRPNRAQNRFAFLEPVKLELKLTNAGSEQQAVEHDLLSDGKHISLLIARKGGKARLWAPFMTRCERHEGGSLAPGQSLYGQHFAGATTSGWLIDEPGLYQVQAAVDIDGDIVVSNVLEIIVGTPAGAEEERMAPDWFTEDVARVLAFSGVPELARATDTVRELVERSPASAAAIHGGLALSSPMLRNFKVLGDGDAPELKVISADLDAGVKAQIDLLTKAPDKAAETLGHIDYFGALDSLATTLKDEGDTKRAGDVMTKSVATMKARNVLKSVIDKAERALARLK